MRVLRLTYSSSGIVARADGRWMTGFKFMALTDGRTGEVLNVSVTRVGMLKVAGLAVLLQYNDDNRAVERYSVRCSGMFRLSAEK
ncbi:hypothetical protein V6N13_016992 [Hibiscus sabdariffa]